MVGDAEPGISGCVLRYVANFGELLRSAPRRAAEHLDGACRRCEHSGGETQQCRLPGAVRADETDDAPDRDAERAI
jgi:hypothetical protein